MSAPGAGWGPARARRGLQPPARSVGRPRPPCPREDAPRRRRSAGRALEAGAASGLLGSTGGAEERAARAGGARRVWVPRPALRLRSLCSARAAAVRARSLSSLSCGAGIFHAGLCSPFYPLLLTFDKLLEPNAVTAALEQATGKGRLRLELSPAGRFSLRESSVPRAAGCRSSGLIFFLVKVMVACAPLSLPKFSLLTCRNENCFLIIIIIIMAPKENFYLTYSEVGR